MLSDKDGLVTDPPWHGFVGGVEVWEFASGGLGFGRYPGDSVNHEALGLSNDDSLASTIRRVFEICDGVS